MYSTYDNRGSLKRLSFALACQYVVGLATKSGKKERFMLKTILVFSLIVGALGFLMEKALRRQCDEKEGGSCWGCFRDCASKKAEPESK
jgi:hypothetical protein